MRTNLKYKERTEKDKKDKRGTKKQQKKCSGLLHPKHSNLRSLSYQRMKQMITICCCHRIHGRCFSAAFLNDGNQGNVPAH